MWLEYLVVYLDVSHTTVLSIYNSSEDFKSMIGGIVILAGGKCVPMDTSWMKSAQLLRSWYPVYTFQSEC